jgi:hypothetical protein
MAITYDDTLTTDRDKVRFWLQDTVSGSGPKPSDGNFSDDELTGLIATYGSWQRAVYAGLTVLANAWRRFPNFRTESGFQVDRTDIADGYQKQALDWARQYGLPTSMTGSSAGYAAMTRVDGYSDDVDNLTP